MHNQDPITNVAYLTYPHHNLTCFNYSVTTYQDAIHDVPIPDYLRRRSEVQNSIMTLLPIRLDLRKRNGFEGSMGRDSYGHGDGGENGWMEREDSIGWKRPAEDCRASFRHADKSW